MTLQSRYTILRKITDGGTAEIFLANQHGAHGFEKAVVLKRIFTAFYADPQFRHMLVDEAHIAMTLNHSNIVQVLDLGEVDGRYFLALELVDGWTLDRTLKRAQAAGVPFPPALALYVTAEVCRALAYAHAKAKGGKPLGIVHRDISPHNVMLSAEGEVKLTDFGIAKAHNKKEQSLGNMIKGKISFMSPEQGSGAAIDARSDLFSLGTMLYVMITRRLPFDAATDYEALMLVKSGDYLPPETARPGLNPELYRVIRKAMNKNADERYQKAEEMLVDVEQVMRLAFRAVGQTELHRWLSDLSAKDGIPPLTREAPAGPLGGATIVDPPRTRDGAGMPTGEESGVVLTLEDAIEVSGGRPPPPPVPTDESIPDLRAGAGGGPWYRRAPVLVGMLAFVLLLAVAVTATRNGRRRSSGAPALATTPPATAPVAAAPPAAPVPAAEPPPPAPVPAAEAPPPAVPPAAPPAIAEKAAPPEAAKPATPEAAKPAAPEGEAASAKADKESAPEEKVDKDTPARASEPAARPHKAAAPATVAVTFRSDPEGAHVSTPKHTYGTTPQAVKLAAGNTYELTFTKAGYVPASKHYVAPAASKGPQTLRVTLKKLPPEPVKKPAAAAPPPPPSSPKKGWFTR
jgi:serine/threonine protein kinase